MQIKGLDHDQIRQIRQVLGDAALLEALQDQLALELVNRWFLADRLDQREQLHDTYKAMRLLFELLQALVDGPKMELDS